jgi:tRNA uridine 5-carbamoylmethylation protein Kti12
MSRKPTVYFLCGIPGSGKSYFARNHLRKATVSTDSYIDSVAAVLGLTYDDCFKHAYPLAEKAMNKEIEHLMILDSSFVWDQTNLDSKVRMKKLARFEGSNYRKVIYYFPTPEEDILRDRLASRSGKTISTELLHSMYARFQYPGFSEGWDEIREFHGDI